MPTSRLLRPLVLTFAGLLAITGTLGATAGPPLPDDDPGSPVLPGPTDTGLDETDRAIALQDLSDGEAAAGGNLDETNRAIALVELTDGVEVASGWPLSANTRSILLVESTFAPGGDLAGWDDIEATQAAADVTVTQPHNGQPY